MTIFVQPLTLQITGRQPRLRAHMQAAWPRTVYTARRSRAIHSITKHITDALPQDYKGDVSVFVSNEGEVAHIPSQGFIYHLSQQNILTHQTIHEADNAALLYIHYETALAMDELDDDAEETVPLSRIEQIKQWQQETVKAVLQCMADTALSMAAQTALRGTMTGLNKLGALLAKASSAGTKLANPATKQAAQKAVTREIASTLSNLRSNLNVASTNSVKPPTKAQLAIRQQLNKLNKITPPTQKMVTKVAQPVKTVPTTKIATLLKTVLATKAAPVQKTQIKTVAAPIKTALLAALAKAETKPSRDIKSAPRISVIPTRIITRITERIAVPVPIQPTRFTARITKVIAQKLNQQSQRNAVPARIATQIVRPATRFQINRVVIPTLRITPAVIAKYIAANPVAINVPPTRTTHKTTQSATQEAVVPKTVIPKTVIPKNVAPTTTAPLQSRPLTQLQRIARQPAQYTAIAAAIPSHRTPPRSFSHIGLVPPTISRVAIQPRFDTSSIAAPVSAAQQTYTAGPTTPAAPPSYVAPMIEQPRSEVTHIAAQPPTPPPAPPTEAKLTEVTAAPSAPISNTAPDDKRGDVTSTEPKQEPKLLDTKATAPEPVKPVAPEKVDGALKVPPTSPTNTPIPPVVRVGQQELPKTPDNTQPTGGILPVNNPENRSPATQHNKPPVTPPAPDQPPAPLPLPLPIHPPKPIEVLPEPREPSNVVPFQPANPDKVGDTEPKPIDGKPTSEVINLEEKRLERSKGLPIRRVPERVEDPHGLIIKVSGGTGIYKEFVSTVEYDHNPIHTKSEAKPPSSLPERPKAQEAYKSKLGRIPDMGC